MPSQQDKNSTAALIAALLFFLAVAVGAFMFFNTYDVNPAIMREGHRYEDYCRQVHLYKETNGREGWRDYRGIYFKECLE
ncbi:hypothetical protein [Marinospirillum perlucidum]|uniref:hypothetical protein n=1 Tax=Marinospirillum perlucidum TaxID=1982602 RepID=UPI000DF33EEE|nr:hypothetical protein [Marinospirillum perlucidum]